MQKPQADVDRKAETSWYIKEVQDLGPGATRSHPDHHIYTRQEDR